MAAATQVQSIPHALPTDAGWSGHVNPSGAMAMPFKAEIDNSTALERGTETLEKLDQQSEATSSDESDQSPATDESDHSKVTNSRRVAASGEPPLPKSIPEKAREVMKVLNRYRLGYENDWDIPEAISRVQTLLEDTIREQKPITLCMPAFPFKSSNRSNKVLGALPDEAERISLLHLNGLCQSITDSIGGECHLIIISDGISYNDLLGVSDSEVWEYGETLRQMAKEQQCTNLRFSRVRDLLEPMNDSHMHDDKVSSKEHYLDMVPTYRRGLEGYLPDGYDAADQISGDTDTAKTYRGYKVFLKTERDVNLGRSRGDKENAAIAKRMLTRGKAFAEAIKAKFASCIRLSIHPSTDINKISIGLLPQENEITMTPWHGAVVRHVDGTVTMTHASDVSGLKYELVRDQHGRPTHFRQRSELFNWEGKDVRFEYQYPTGIIVTPANPSESYALCTVDMQKVRQLAELCSPVVLRGFKDTMDRQRYTAKAYDLGDVQPWKSGVIQEVKDEANKDAESNSVVSSEAMPMHYDGMFKLITVKDEATGQEKQVSDTPRFQYFVSQTVASPGDGYTLFSSSARFARHLPKSYNMQKLSKIRWTVRSNGFFHHKVENVDLIVPHPTLGTPCVRWHQPWPKWRTEYGWADITIENGSQSLVRLVDSVLFDRRVCLYFAWQKGDILVSDNHAMLHTRTAFKSESGREIWRIHVN